MTQKKLDMLEKKLLEIKESFDTWKNSGLDEEIMIIYIHHKTGLSMKDVKHMLNSQEEFYDKLVKDAIVERLTK